MIYNIIYIFELNLMTYYLKDTLKKRTEDNRDRKGKCVTVDLNESWEGNLVWQKGNDLDEF